jgi:hypothetical protein
MGTRILRKPFSLHPLNPSRRAEPEFPELLTKGNLCLWINLVQNHLTLYKGG